MTYTLIAHTELTSSQASITFSSIPATFTDLKLVFSLRGDASSAYNDSFVQFNGDTGGNYSFRRLYGTGSSAASDAASSGSNFGRVGSSVGSTSTASTFANGEVYIPNYRSSAAKSFSSDGVTENNGAGAFQVIYADLYSGTSPITSLTLNGLSTNFISGSSATLYGITAGSSGRVVVS
jgi:hypothetical protein